MLVIMCKMDAAMLGLGGAGGGGPSLDTSMLLLVVLAVVLAVWLVVSMWTFPMALLME